VTRIKERVEEKEGIPPAQQRLIYGGKQMYVPASLSSFPERLSHLYLCFPYSFHTRDIEIQVLIIHEHHRADEKTAADFNLEGGSTLHLVLALRGGY